MLANALVALIRLYQLTLSRVILAAFGPVCRFEPSCSRYAVACIQGHGALRGSLLSLKRLCKCHPFHPGGVDPPPPPRGKSGSPRASGSNTGAGSSGDSTNPPAATPDADSSPREALRSSHKALPARGASARRLLLPRMSM